VIILLENYLRKYLSIIPQVTEILLKRNPKTQTILTIIAEQGPKTEYDLYKQKQLEKMSRGTIHFCLNKLYQELLLKIVFEESPRKKKQFHLTFRGAISYLNSLNLEPEPDLSNLKLHTSKSIEERIKMQKEKEEQYLDEQMVEFEKLKHFLEDFGNNVDYPLFREMPWLVEHFGHSVLYDILYAAKVLEAIPPTSTRFAFMKKQTDEVLEELKRLKHTPQSHIEEKNNRGTEEVGDAIQLKALSQNLEETKKRMNELVLKSHSVSKDYSWRNAFGANFAYKFLMSNHPRKSKKDNHNEILRLFFDEVALAIRTAEVVPSEEMADIFSD
jgi:hypothetical protein